MTHSRLFILVFALPALFYACDPNAGQQNSSTAEDTTGTSTQQATPEETTADNTSTAETGRIVSEGEEPLPGKYAILYGSFGSQIEAEDNSRALRALRVNCYLYKTKDKQYGALIGPYKGYSHAQKKLEQLEKKGMENLSLYYLGEE